jgi:hypothetical protein
MKLSFEQNEKENKKEFVERLIEAGWTKAEAEIEWLQIQTWEY